MLYLGFTNTEEFRTLLKSASSKSLDSLVEALIQNCDSSFLKSSESTRDPFELKTLSDSRLSMITLLKSLKSEYLITNED